MRWGRPGVGGLRAGIAVARRTAAPGGRAFRAQTVAGAVLRRMRQHKEATAGRHG